MWILYLRCGLFCGVLIWIFQGFSKDSSFWLDPNSKVREQHCETFDIPVQLAPCSTYSLLATTGPFSMHSELSLPDIQQLLSQLSASLAEWNNGPPGIHLSVPGRENVPRQKVKWTWGHLLLSFLFSRITVPLCLFSNSYKQLHVFIHFYRWWC